MKTKTFLICWITAFIIMFALDLIFHGILSAGYFEPKQDQPIPDIHKMKDANVFLLGLFNLVLTFGITYLITKKQTDKILLENAVLEASLTGGLIKAMIGCVWDLANPDVFNWFRISPAVDFIWHFLLGAIGGIIIAIAYNRMWKS